MFYLDRKLLSIDFLKGIAMIMVILVHYNLSFSAKYSILAFGQMGCPLFFVVSGFLSARSYHKKCLSNKNAKKEFLFSKIKSIAPAWWLLIFSLFIINFISLKLSGKVITGKYDFIALIVNALFLHGMTPSYMNTFSGGWYIGTLMILYFLTPYIFSLFKI